MEKQNLLGVGNNWVIDLEQSLGGGSYGSVYVSYKLDQENVKYAAKKIPLTADKKDTDKINTELRIFNKVNSPYVVQMHSFKKTQNSVYIFMDLCNEGSLSTYMRNNGRLSIETAISFFQKMTSGYKAIREQKVIHRDIKPDNILIDNGIPKITDFGLGKIYEEFQQMQQNDTKTLVGSEYYMAPELLVYVINARDNNGRLSERPHYTDKCDVWSMGLVFYYMLEGKRPWEFKESTRSYLNNIKNIPITLQPSWPLEACHLITRMLTVDVNSRITWEEIFAHPMIDQSAVNNVNLNQLQQQFQQQIQQYMSLYNVQQQIPTNQLSYQKNFAVPQQHVLTSQMPKKMGDSIEQSIEMEEEN